MFAQLINTLKKSPKTIVFTEGTDPRILEASARLLSGNFLKPVLVRKAELQLRLRPPLADPFGAEIRFGRTRHACFRFVAVRHRLVGFAQHRGPGGRR